MLDEGAGGLCLCIIFPILLLSTKPIFYDFVCYSIWYLYFVLFFCGYPIIVYICIDLF